MTYHATSSVMAATRPIRSGPETRGSRQPRERLSSGLYVSYDLNAMMHGRAPPLPCLIPQGAMLSTRLQPAPCWARFVELLTAVLPMMLVGQPMDSPTTFPSATL